MAVGEELNLRRPHLADRKPIGLGVSAVGQKRTSDEEEFLELLDQTTDKFLVENVGGDGLMSMSLC